MNHQRLILSGYLLRPRRPSRHDHHRYHTSSIVSSINWVRDRALDHAVEKERDLKPMINIKNLLISEPSKSLPISIISDKKTSLGLSNIIRPIEFIRKYPSVFQEYLPGGIGVHPHVKLTQETLDIHSEEDHFLDTNEQKIDVSNRLLKLLMLGRVNKLPLDVIDRLKWDLGLPNDYINTIVPCFPDYFQVSSRGNELELVCWNNELAVSVMDEKKLSSFSLQYSRGFEMDNKFKKWVDDWQKLPYVSPYENAKSCDENESDKWIVGLLHEILNIMVPMKTEKDNLLILGECLGVRSRFKRALLEHPGIFYVSSKLHTHTVVLREGYKRDLLVGKPVHPLMSLRSAYIHLMNMVKREEKNKSEEVDDTKDSNEGEEEDEDEWSENESENEQDYDDSGRDDVTDGEKENDVADGRAKMDREGKNDDSVKRGRRQDGENGNTRIRGKPSREMKFTDSPRRNTPNARSSENDGRRRGGGRGRERTRKNVVNEKTDSRSNRTSDSRTTRTSDSRTYQRSDRRTNQMSDSRTNEMSDSRTNQMSDRRSNQMSDRRTNQMSDRKERRETNGPRGLRTEAPGARRDFGRGSNRSGASRTRE
uniref:protein WHAT'S THIS FACTOR 9, mitochondrial-like n=1 Tax=Erigeron canadensis TaxID=72917 RepID=UPI001CB97537|nr:protein WHAT'S THIS FACTOR 9, mitochondrial-like [Erigeron canadensis]